MSATGDRGETTRAARAIATTNTQPEEGPMTGQDRKQLARELYVAFARADREVVESLLSEDFTFFSPYDVGIDRAAYFERCWPNSGTLAGFTFPRVVEVGDEVVVTYESTKTDGRRFRNTEVLTFAGEQIARAEVYFGWDIE
jgi:ketosteroid isomerase-like protein